jgi:quercetin dioxygenase-like cupin family protein
MVGNFTDWTSEPGREVMAGDVIWDVTGENLQVIRAQMAPGAVFPLHEHPQEQVIVVLEGALEFTVAEETRIVTSGQVIHISPGVPHGGRVHGPHTAVTIEAFHPIRNDFRRSSTAMDLRWPR